MGGFNLVHRAISPESNCVKSDIFQANTFLNSDVWLLAQELLASYQAGLEKFGNIL